MVVIFLPLTLFFSKLLAAVCYLSEDNVKLKLFCFGDVGDQKGSVLQLQNKCSCELESVHQIEMRNPDNAV